MSSYLAPGWPVLYGSPEDAGVAQLAEQLPENSCSRHYDPDQATTGLSGEFPPGD